MWYPLYPSKAIAHPNKLAENSRFGFLFNLFDEIKKVNECGNECSNKCSNECGNERSEVVWATLCGVSVVN